MRPRPRGFQARQCSLMDQITLEVGKAVVGGLQLLPVDLQLTGLGSQIRAQVGQRIREVKHFARTRYGLPEPRGRDVLVAVLRQHAASTNSPQVTHSVSAADVRKIGS